MSKPTSGSRMALGVAVSALLVLVGLSACAGQAPQGQATPHLAATPTVDALHPDPAQGWVTVAALQYAGDIIFTRSDPYTGYVCGAASATPQVTDALWLAVTQNGGRTWTTPQATPLRNQTCMIWTNPSNAQDIFLAGRNFQFPSNYPLPNPPSDDHYARSVDGGRTWTNLSLPAGNQGDTSQRILQPIWAGSTLFVEADGPPHMVAASVNSGPLQWVDTHAPFFGAGYYDFGGFFAIGNTFSVINTPQNQPVTIAQTSDGGATWTTFPAQGLSGAAYPVVAADGQAVIVSTDQLSRSTDGGRHWTSLPALPANRTLWANIQQIRLTQTPDGVIYATLADTSGAGGDAFYTLAPGATAWTPMPGANWSDVDAVTWDAQGHAVVAWKLILANYIGGGPIGVAYRGI